MKNKINHPMSKRQGAWAACLLMLAFILSQPDKTLAQSQWTSTSLINAANAISSHQTTAQSPVESQSKKGGKPDITIQSTTSGKLAKFSTSPPPPAVEDSVITELANGNVGIGTTSPSNLLHVTGRIRTDADILSVGGGGQQAWKNSTPTAAINFGMAVPGQSPTNDMIFSTYQPWTERMRITTAGATLGSVQQTLKPS